MHAYISEYSYNETQPLLQTQTQTQTNDNIKNTKFETIKPFIIKYISNRVQTYSYADLYIYPDQIIPLSKCYHPYFQGCCCCAYQYKDNNRFCKCICDCCYEQDCTFYSKCYCCNYFLINPWSLEANTQSHSYLSNKCLSSEFNMYDKCICWCCITCCDDKLWWDEICKDLWYCCIGIWHCECWHRYICFCKSHTITTNDLQLIYNELILFLPLDRVILEHNKFIMIKVV
jgi:hypothetical protein